MADFVVYDVCTISSQIMRKAEKKSPFEGHPKLDGLCKRVRSDPKLEAYFASAAAKMPFNNRMARSARLPARRRCEENSRRRNP